MKKLQPLDEETMHALERLLTRPDLPSGAMSRRMLERYVVGDLTPAEGRAINEAVREDPELGERLATLRAADRTFDREMPWDSVRDSITSRAASLPSEAPDLDPARTNAVAINSRRAWRAVFGGVVVALGLLIVAFLFGPPTEPGFLSQTIQEPGPNRYKSADDALSAYVLVGGQSQRLTAGDRVSAGDRIQFRVSTPHDHLALIGVDGTGTVSRYAPVGGEMSVPFVPGNARPLPDSLQLDDAPGPEVFIAFLSDEPLLVEDLERAVHDVVTSSPGGSRSVLTEDWAAHHLAPQVSLFGVEKD